MAVSDQDSRSQCEGLQGLQGEDRQEGAGATKLAEKPPFEITVSENKLEAWLTVYRKPDAGKDPAGLAETANAQHVLAAVENRNIKMNLDAAAIQTEILRPSSRPVTIAKGKAPVQGQDARLELFFSEKIESLFMEAGGLIDYKNHMRIPSVQKGDVIARKIPPVEGRMGYDVYGNALFPDPVEDIPIEGRGHVVITPEGLVIADEEGRPRVSGHRVKYFDINTAFCVPGNVDLQTGNIIFSGDVVVYGDVMDHLVIESLGNIYVQGSVFNAVLTATGSIAVQGNVLGSKLHAGYFGARHNKLHHCLRPLIDMFENVMECANVLLYETDRRRIQARYGQVLALIMASRYPKAENAVKELLGIVSDMPFYDKEELRLLYRYLRIFLERSAVVEVMTVSKMEHFVRVLNNLFTQAASGTEEQAQIHITQCQNSTLKSSGDILIKKEGVIQSDLYSGGSIAFDMDNAVCRGSRLEAGDAISAKYVGSTTGVGTVLKAARKIAVKKMFEGRIMIDRYSLDILEPVEEAVFDRESMMRRAGEGGEQHTHTG